MTAARKAEAWLRQHLRDGRWMRAEDVKRAARTAGIGRDTLKRVAVEVCERDVDSGNHTYWRIPVARPAAWFSPAIEGRDAP